jgi:hypothetical protein
MAFYEETPILRTLMYDEGLADLRWSLKYAIVNAKAAFQQMAGNNMTLLRGGPG